MTRASIRMYTRCKCAMLSGKDTPASTMLRDGS